LDLYRDWFQQNVVDCRWTEQRVVSNLFGYAGTADLLIQHRVHGLCLVDLKTQKISAPHPGPLPGRGGEGDGARSARRPTKPKPYSTWCYQLAAYRAALGVRATCINLIVNSVTPEMPVEHVWSESEMESGLRAFMAARELWNIENNYTPGGGPVLADGHHAAQVIDVEAVTVTNTSPRPSPQRGEGGE
ncbi:MAG: hypothetical protein WCS42_13500, partial [Verrucomicrobiota bacterium]